MIYLFFYTTFIKRTFFHNVVALVSLGTQTYNMALYISTSNFAIVNFQSYASCPKCKRIFNLPTFYLDFFIYISCKLLIWSTNNPSYYLKNSRNCLVFWKNIRFSPIFSVVSWLIFVIFLILVIKNITKILLNFCMRISTNFLLTVINDGNQQNKKYFWRFTSANNGL